MIRPHITIPCLCEISTRCEMTLNLPSPQLQISIRKELNENLETRDQYLEHIKDWLRRQPHLPDDWGKNCKSLNNPDS